MPVVSEGGNALFNARKAQRNKAGLSDTVNTGYESPLSTSGNSIRQNQWSIGTNNENARQRRARITSLYNDLIGTGQSGTGQKTRLGD